MNVFGRDRREGLGRRSHSVVGSLLLLLVSGFLLLSSLYAAQASVFQKARESALQAASPVLSLFSGPVGFVEEMIGGVRDYFFVLEQNKALREEIAALRMWEQEARDLRDVLGAYEALGHLRAPPGAVSINAAVIGESNDAFVHTMIVNAGAADNVRKGLAVVDDRGLVGHVVTVSRDAARVLLLTDVQSNVPVYVEGGDVEGILSGQTRSDPAITFTRNDDLDLLAPGQKVFTSGAGGVMPRGLPVGVIARVGDSSALVALDSNYARTRIVRILNYTFPEITADGGVAGASGEGRASPAANAAQVADATGG